jgi:hypothetical protein
MTNYVVTTPVNGSFTVPAGATNTATSLVLIGRGASGYGQIVASNTILQLENFAGPTAPTAPLIGQLWYDSGNVVLNYYNGTIWCQLALESDLAAYATLAEFDIVQAEVNALMLLLTDPPAGSTPIPIGAGGTGLNTIGAPNFVFTVNPAGTGYTWTDPASFIPSSTNIMHTTTNNVPVTDITFNLGSTTQRYANIYSQLFQGTATSAQYADLAERYESDCLLEAGDVVILGGSKEITKSNEAFSTDVFGIISTAPAYMMNSDAGDDTTHPYVALSGRLPVKVIGQVKKGQRLVTSAIAGVAQAAKLHDITNSFVVIGRALADKITDGVDFLEVTVGAK